jgi:nicotinate-nucleotide adenylyltransferase
MQIAFFGGAFDPPHAEHLKIALNAFRELKLDKLIFVPSLKPPHKETPETPFKNRLEMLELCIKDCGEMFAIDGIESEVAAVHNYTYETLPLLKQKYKVEKPYFLIGSDSLIKLNTWCHPELLVKECILAVAVREGESKAETAAAKEFLEKNYDAQIVFLGGEYAEISSTELRFLLECGECPSEIPEQIYKYILENRLFLSYDRIVAEVKKRMSEERFIHSKNVAFYAARFARRLGLNAEKVFLSAILHDIAKEISPLKPLDEYKDNAPKVIHQYDAVDICKRDFGIQDDDILGAVKYHTTGCADMTPLQKLIYSADKLEDTREYEGVEEIRDLIIEDFEKGFLLLLKKNCENVVEKCGTLSGTTKEAYDYYFPKKEN